MSDKKKEIFVGTLTAPYDTEKYLTFLRELLSNMEQIAPYKNMSPYNTFSIAVDHYNHIGNYVGQDNNKVAVFSVCLKDYRNIENARSMQRGFVKSLLEHSDCAGALVAFHTKDKPKKWRLSLVRMDYEFSKGKLSEKLTPAKRYSYLVGEGEPCHTAQERLYPIFVNDNFNPGLDELEEAFSVEAVTKDFFDQYREKYLDLKDYLDGNTQFKEEAESRGFDSEQFAKKLLGQIVFLYFIQKKGWLGVNAFPPDLTKREYNDAFYCRGYGSKPKELLPIAYKPTQDGKFARDSKAIRSLSDENQTLLSKFVKGSAWGDGPKDFMRQLFKACKSSGKNYFDDYLEPLFYDGLNHNRGENAFFPSLHCRIPFLNGGLFEEMEGYDWRNNPFSIPNELFSNADEKGWDADGILDVFDRYNFTMAEDEPMEREVAIDPEMLGKVFENLLDIKDRKSKGAFYTPREIVHYMCQESLINYLAGKTGIPSDDIRKFVLYGEYFRDEDVKKTLFVKGRDGVKGHKEFDRNKPLEIPETILSYRNGVNRLREIDELLANVKVVDLAVGSGAFPLGMLNEIVRARDTITSYMTIEMNPAQRLNCRSDRNLYRLKRDAIKNSIFACDIEPSATDITKLRLWLSLVIDNVIQEQDDEILGYSTKPRELPNLDCNVICGNSLMDSFRGFPLITESSALNNLSANSQTSVYDPHVARMINALIELQSDLYDEKDRNAKESLKRRIQDIYDEIIFAQIGDSGDSADEYRQSIALASRPFVLWQLYFPKVFRDNGGFDIAIGNPPYVNVEKIANREAIFEAFSTCSGRTDLYIAFIEKGSSLLTNNGTLSFIIPFAYTNQNYGEASRNMLIHNFNIDEIVDTSNYPVFDTAMVKNIILRFSKRENQRKTRIRIANSAEEFASQQFHESYIDQELFSSLPGKQFKTNEFQQASGIKSKIDSVSIRLGDICLIAYGVRVNNKTDKSKPKSYYLRDSYEAGLKPFIEGRNIQRYYHEQNGWLNYSPSEHYNPMFPELFENEKIIFIRVVNECLRFSYDDEHLYNSHTVLNCVRIDSLRSAKHSSAKKACKNKSMNDFEFISQYNMKFILGILNSKLINWYFMTFMSDGLNFYPENAKQLPLIDLRKAAVNQEEIISLVDKIIEGKSVGKSTADLEKQLDSIVFHIYGLSDDEICIIDSQ